MMKEREVSIMKFLLLRRELGSSKGKALGNYSNRN
jgi:hypothetical protein